jgi:hypothetical protein
MENGEVIKQIITIAEELGSQIISNPIIQISEEYKLATINHNLNSYPNIRVLYEEYGAGLGGAGTSPTGGDPTHTIKNIISYDDKNNLTVYIPKEYLGSNPVVEKVSNTEYIVTFNDSIISLILNVIN